VWRDGDTEGEVGATCHPFPPPLTPPLPRPCAQVRYVSPAGIITTVLGVLGTSGFGANGIPATACLIGYPQGLTSASALGRGGSFLVADFQGGSVRLILENGTAVGFAGTVRREKGRGAQMPLAETEAANSPNPSRAG
jgi:hypothetical protein